MVNCGLEQDRRELAHDRPAWQGVVKACVDTINKEAEQKEDRRKDKKRRTQQSRRTAALAGFLPYLYSTLPSALSCTGIHPILCGTIRRVLRKVKFDV